MKLLARDPVTGGRTWRDPRDLEKLISRGPSGLAAIVIEGKHVIASTGPILEPQAMLWHAGLPTEGLSQTDDSRLFRGSFARAEIGTLRGLVSKHRLSLFFYFRDTCPIRLGSDGSHVPDVSPDTIDSIAEYVRGHEQMQTAFPRGIKLEFHLTNYAGAWSYSNGERHFHLAPGFSTSRIQSYVIKRSRSGELASVRSLSHGASDHRK